MIEVRYDVYWGGWLAFRSGKVLRTRDLRVKVFRSEESARSAGAKARPSAYTGRKWR